MYTINAKDGKSTYKITDSNKKTTASGIFNGHDNFYKNLVSNNPFLPQNENLEMFYREYNKEKGVGDYKFTGTYTNLNLEEKS